jgi:hypothetical protein
MRIPSQEGGLEEFRDGDVTIHIGPEVLNDHAKTGGIVFYFGMFDHCRVRLDEVRGS